jgi:hypothetical protein
MTSFQSRLINHLDVDASSDSKTLHSCDYVSSGEFNISYKTVCSDNFCALHINCRSLAANFDSIFQLVTKDLNSLMDVIICSETWLQDVCADLYNLPGYNIFHQQRINARGGVCIYVRDIYVAHPKECHLIARTTFEHYQLSISLKPNPVIVSAIYRPPYSSLRDFIDEFNAYIEFLHECTSNVKAIICIAGDFNINLLSSDTNSLVGEFLDTMYAHFLFPSILKPSRITANSATLIDNIFINNPLTIKSGLVLADISDHLPVFAVFDKCFKKNLLPDNNESKSYRNFSSFNVNKFSNMLGNCDWDFITEHSDINEDYKLFLTQFLNKFNLCFPELPGKRKRVRDKPWLSVSIINSCKYKQKLYNQMIRGIIPYPKYVAYKNTLTNVIRKAKIRYFTDFVNRHKKDSRAMWGLINSQIGRAVPKSSPSFNTDANTLNEFFANLGNLATKNIQAHNGDIFATLNQPAPNSLFLTPTSINEIILIVTKLAPKMSCGFDSISVKLIKQIIGNIAAPLCKIFNKSLSIGVFPDLLKIARIIPIFKSGDSEDLKNYRPISLLPSFSKILEQIIHTRMISYLNKQSTLHSSQHGFRINHSTMTAVIDVLESITSALNNKFFSIALFVDVSKAFDSIDHRLLLSKLHVYGIRGVALKLIESYLYNRYQYTVVNDVNSHYCKITMGLPQGSILGPLMYTIFVNDMFNVNGSVKCVLYADDTVIIVSAKTTEDLFILASYYFSLFSRWFTVNKLCLNSNKTKFIVFGTCGHDNLSSIVFDTHTVHRVSEIRYLGIIIDEKLCWKSHINCVRDKLAKGIGMLKMCYSLLPKSCLLLVYYSFLLPYLQYGIEVWGSTYSTYLQPLRVLQKRGIRLICHASYTAHCTLLAHNLGILLIDDLLLYSLACLMFKVKNCTVPDVICHIFVKLTEVHMHQTRLQSSCFFVPQGFNRVRFNFVAYKGVSFWNTLPSNITNLSSFCQFKYSVFNFLLLKYLD